MSDNDLIVIVPTRGRRANCERLLKSFTETATCADIAFILDPDDEATYDGMDWGPAASGILAPRGTLQQKLNQAAALYSGAYSRLMWTGDDHVFRTPAWDALMLRELDGMGGHGWVYPATVRRSDVPEIWMASASVVDLLGWFFPPVVQQYCGDNAVAELAKRAGLIRFCPSAVVEHLHWSVDPGAEHDATYTEAEQAHGQADLAAFQQWRTDQLPLDVSLVRRHFSRDIQWVTSLV